MLTSHLQRSFISEDDLPSQSFTSYTIGLATLGAAYYVQSLAFPIIEGGTAAAKELQAISSQQAGNLTKNVQQGGPGKYVPPKDMAELARRVLPPITLRLGASSVAFFCAGALQTYVALKQQPSTKKR